MADFKKTIATAEAKEFLARLEATRSQDAAPRDVLSAHMPSRQPCRTVARCKQLNQQR